MVELHHPVAARVRSLLIGISILVALQWIAASDLIARDVQVPTLKHYATDLSGTLSADELSRLDGMLSSFDQSTSTQIVVLLIPSLNGEDLEEYSLRVAEANRIGRKGKDNGALLIVSLNDRKARIEVGYGLEGVLPDALAGQIIRQEITPHFRGGDYYGGLRAGVEAIMSATKNEYQAEPSSQGTRRTPALLYVIVAIAFVLIRFTRRRRGMFFGGPWIGGGWGGGSGGGGFGGGGFSGGGGSFGGGGASGSW